MEWETHVEIQSGIDFEFGREFETAIQCRIDFEFGGEFEIAIQCRIDFEFGGEIEMEMQLEMEFELRLDLLTQKGCSFVRGEASEKPNGSQRNRDDPTVS
jgi:hypothetical protein